MVQRAVILLAVVAALALVFLVPRAFDEASGDPGVPPVQLRPARQGRAGGLPARRPGRAGRVHGRAAREGARARPARLGAGGARRGAARRRPPAPHSGDDGARAERGPAHEGGRPDLDRQRRRRLGGEPVGPRHRAGHPQPRPGAHLRALARTSASRRRSEGAGLGLSIVRAIAESHDGRVELVSRPGAGATFTIVVPLRGPEVAAPR